MWHYVHIYLWNVKGDFNLCSDIVVFYVTQEEIHSSEEKLQERFSVAKTIPGTQKLHRIIPVSTNELKVFPLSQSTMTQNVAICNIVKGSDDENTCEPIFENYPVSSFIACIYEQKWWIGIVKQQSDEHNDLLVSFMHPSGEAKQYSWPQKEDSCWVDKGNIICSVSCPSMSSSSTRGYSFPDSDIMRIKDQFPVTLNRNFWIDHFVHWPFSIIMTVLLW